MAYDVIELRFRVPGRFDTFAFMTALQRLIWDKLHGDRAQTGVTSLRLTPCGGPDPFSAAEVTCYLRIEEGRVSFTQLRTGIERYFVERAKFTTDEAWVLGIRSKPSALVSDF